jgi:hypothetical protein
VSEPMRREKTRKWREFARSASKISISAPWLEKGTRERDDDPYTGMLNRPSGTM